MQALLENQLPCETNQHSRSFSASLKTVITIKFLTIAQVFWMKEATGQPSRLFVGFEGELSIDTHFTKFGTDITGLRKKLRNHGVETFDTFPAYSAWF